MGEVVEDSEEAAEDVAEAVAANANQDHLLLEPHVSLLWSFLQVILIGVGRHSLCHVLCRIFRILYHLFRQVSWWTWFELGIGSVWNCSGWISILGNE